MQTCRQLAQDVLLSAQPATRLILQDCEDDPVRVLNPEGWLACLMPAGSSNFELPVQNHAADDDDDDDDDDEDDDDDGDGDGGDDDDDVDFDNVTVVAFRGSRVKCRIALGSPKPSSRC